MDTPPNNPQQTPPAGGVTSRVAKPGRKRSTGRIVGLSAVGLVALLVIVLVGSELWFRHSSTSCIADMVKKGTGADAKVSLSKKPVLLQYASGTAPSIDIDIPDNLNNTPGLSAKLHLTDVQVKGDNKIGSATVVGSMSSDGILSRVKSVPLVGDPKVKLDKGAGTIDITGTMLFAPLEINLKPELKGGKLQLTAGKVNVMGFGVPDDLAQQLIDAVDGGLPTPKGLKADDVDVTDQNVSVTYSGQNVTPADLASGSNDLGGGCSV
ncbi:DUF2993 domain-containing protein [Tsukamurella sp. 8F]|uniref:DUF2993 domain-containing protein n=1 Tax=unclassified Tsukamurella TaxID=2633480 RepID=UPI0023B9279B|nr:MULTISPECIES: DUF2993 domain-containing protein [unclassified Tsukamurella]MDF0528316.1 DUF2993 domain-containing protein [Tsukamurella sp. 8J]MDF0586141.1 DUF2993 domain-containing protein [Tsukamurella sp. 8F]